MPLLNNTMYRLTGIRPTGRMHVGHYFSVIKPALELNATVLIAEYHAPKASSEECREMLDTLSRYGVRDVRLQSKQFNAKLYFQLLSIARVGELERMTQYQSSVKQIESEVQYQRAGDVQAQGDSNDAHLLVYPVLMVHDVMGYDEILIGDDQTQHINYARDLIERYNRVFRAGVRLPTARPVGGRVMSLADPTKKMSKSIPVGCLFLDDSPSVIENKIKLAVMDEAGHANLVELYRNLGGTEEIPLMNSEFKPMVTTAVLRALSDIVHEEV